MGEQMFKRRNDLNKWNPPERIERLKRFEHFERLELLERPVVYATLDTVSPV